MDTLTLPSDCLAVPSDPLATWSPLPVDMSRMRKLDREEGEGERPWFAVDRLGIVRNPSGLPQVVPGSVTPISSLDLHEDAPAVMAGAHIACGLAAAAWRQSGGGVSVADRDMLICLIEDACPILDSTLAETFCIAEHEVQPARERAVSRMAVDTELTRRFGEARAIMTAGCAFFPWYQKDGSIPG